MPRNRRTFIKRHIDEYCENSSLAGVKYVVAKDRSVFERAWWMIAITCSFLLSLYLIRGLWVKWYDSPVIVSFAEKSTSVWEIPFPAITICSRSRVRRSVFNYTKYYEMDDNELTEDERGKLLSVELLCLRPDRCKEGEFLINESRIDFLEKVTEEFLEFCNFGNGHGFIYCKNFFTPIMTDQGYCFTSNSLSHSDIYHKDGLHSKYLKSLPNATDWDLESGYDNRAHLNTYPRRIISSGMTLGLMIHMWTNNSEYDRKCSGLTGFTVTLHNPAEIAPVSDQFFDVPLSQIVSLAVKPNMMTTSRNLQSYSPEQRQCYFAHERKLAFFKVYTQKNCEMECQTNYSLKECGCVWFHMPRAKDTPICGGKSHDCVLFNATEKKINDEIHAKFSNEVGSTCNCLQSCTSIAYGAEKSQGYFMDAKDLMLYVDRPELIEENSSYSVLAIYFKDAQFIASHRSASYGLSNFLGICGGLLGLTNGFCLLSLVEIIYYLTLRLYNNYYSEEEEERNDTEMDDLGELNV